MIKLAEAAKYLRNRLGLTQREAAIALKISHIHVHNIESGKSSPTATVIEKYYDAWQIDLYMLAVAKFSEERFPGTTRPAAQKMVRAWEKEIEARIVELRNGSPCEECRN